MLQIGRVRTGTIGGEISVESILGRKPREAQRGVRAAQLGPEGLGLTPLPSDSRFN